MQQKTATNILWFGECLWLLHYKHLYSWWRITQTIYIPSEIHEKIPQWNKCSTYLRNWHPNNQTRSMEWAQLTGKIIHGNIYLWLVIKKSSVSCTKSFTYFQILYYVLERWTWTHNLIMHGKTGWWANGTWVEYLPRIHHIAALPQSPRVPVEYEHRARRFHRTDHLHVNVQRHLMWDLKKMNGNAN